MKLKKFIKFIIKWRLPYSNKVIITEYLMSVPRGIKKSQCQEVLKKVIIRVLLMA